MFVQFCLLYISEKADISEIQNIAKQTVRRVQSGKIAAYLDDDATICDSLKTAIEKGSK